MGKLMLSARESLPIPWRNPWYWTATCLLVGALLWLNSRFISGPIIQVAEAVPFDGRARYYYPREYGWPWGAVTISTRYQDQLRDGRAVPVERLHEIHWGALLGDSLLAVGGLWLLGRVYERADRDRVRGFWRVLPVRLGLRAFFVLFTLIVVWLGDSVRQGVAQKQILDDLRARGVGVLYEHEYHGDGPGSNPRYGAEPPRPLLRKLFGSEWGVRVIAVGLNDVQGNPAVVLEDLSSVRGIQMITFTPRSETEVDDDVLRALQKFSALRQIFVTGASDTARARYVEALPNCNVMPFEGWRAFAENRRREQELASRKQSNTRGAIIRRKREEMRRRSLQGH